MYLLMRNNASLLASPEALTAPAMIIGHGFGEESEYVPWSGRQRIDCQGIPHQNPHGGVSQREHLKGP